jgi:3-oxoadipate enol-lactonase
MELHVEVAGAGPPVVLLHAGVADARMWDPQWVTFPRVHRTVRYDLRGFGRSPLPPGSFSHAGDLVALLDRLGIGRTALVGVSLGGRVALEAAVARPDLVDALVVVGASLPGHAWSDELEAFDAEEDAALERGDLDTAVELNVRLWVDGRRAPGGGDPATRAAVAEMQRHAFELQLPVADEVDEQLLVPDLADRLGEVRAPTLVLVGEEDVADIHVIAERLAREVPGAQRAAIPGAAHLPSMERPAEFDELVLGFLAGAASRQP